MRWVGFVWGGVEASTTSHADLHPKLKQSRSPITLLKPSGRAKLAFDESCCKSNNALFYGVKEVLDLVYVSRWPCGS